MKSSELKHLIREVVSEVMTETAPPDFPKGLYKKIKSQYSDNPSKAYGTMWKIHNAKNEGNSRANKIYEAFGSKKDWDVDEMHVNVDGKEYFTYANFDWEEKSIGHRHDPRRGYSGQGQDEVGNVPVKVSEIEAFDENDTPITDPSLLAKISKAVIQKFSESEEGVRGRKWDKWS